MSISNTASGQLTGSSNPGGQKTLRRNRRNWDNSTVHKRGPNVYLSKLGANGAKSIFYCIYRAVAISTERACLIRGKSFINFNHRRSGFLYLDRDLFSTFPLSTKGLSLWASTTFCFLDLIPWHGPRAIVLLSVIIIPATVAFWQHSVNGAIRSLFRRRRSLYTFYSRGSRRLHGRFWSAD